MLSGKYIINGTMSLGTYITFSTLFPRVIAPIQLIATNAITIQPGLIAVTRLVDLFGQFIIKENRDRITLDKLDGNIIINNLKFKYEGELNYVLDNFSLKIDSGEWVELRGENGSGKTTLIKLISGLYDGYEGSIIIDGHNLENLDKHTYLNKLGMVSQDVFLFNGTIKDNIFYGIEDMSNTCFEIEEFDQIFRLFPAGLSTVVGENGQLLSGGQKQLIAVARVLLKKPDILIFDEATANMDIDTKTFIFNICNKYFRNKTSIFITHEQASLFHADRAINLS